MDQALLLLKARGMITVGKGGKLAASGKHFRGGDKLSSEAIRNYHLENLTLAKKSLIEQDAETRDFTASTFTASKAVMAKVRQEIRQFHARITALGQGSKARDELFKLHINFFPMSFAPAEEKLKAQSAGIFVDSL